MEDGSVSAKQPELLALGLADGLSLAEAWTAAGGTNTGPSVKYRRSCVENGVFQARRDALIEERAQLEAQGPLGEALWMAKQTWRTARATGEVDKMLAAARLMADLAKTLQAGGVADDGAAPAENGEIPRGPGRPSQEPRSAKLDPHRLRRELQEFGIEPAADADEEAA